MDKQDITLGPKAKEAARDKLGRRPITYQVGNRSGTIRSGVAAGASSAKLVSDELGEKHSEHDSAPMPAQPEQPRAPGTHPAAERKPQAAWTSGPGWTGWLWRPLPGLDTVPAGVWAFVLPAAALVLFYWLTTQLAA